MASSANLRPPANATAPAHVTAAWPNGSFETPAGLFGRLSQSILLFGDAVAAQSALLDARSVRWDRFGSIAAYAFSVYGISTFFVALILNRTAAIASLAGAGTRAARGGGPWSLLRRLPVPQGVGLALLRLLAVVLLARQACNVLVALGVHGRFGDPQTACRLARWVPQRYFAYDPAVYAHDRYMRMPRDEVVLGPTTDMLWPVFLAVSYSLVVETFAAAMARAPPFLQGGLTLFELSLALQEASAGFLFPRAHVAARRPSEQVLAVCLFALADHVCSHAGAVLYANRYRLVPLTVLSAVFVWYFCTHLPGGRVFDMPLEIALTYLALVATLAVVGVCAAVLVLAVLTKGARVDELNVAQFFADAPRDGSLLADHLGLSLSQDFYTAAINLGMVAVTHAGKASYFLAYSYVPAPRRTWAEQGLWDLLAHALSVPGNPASDPHGALRGPAEPRVLGYDNVIKTPPQHWLNGAGGAPARAPRVSTIKLRVLFVAETWWRFGQLVKWGVLHVLYHSPKQWLVRRLSARRVAHDAGQGLVPRSRVPPFVRHILETEERLAALAALAAEKHTVQDWDEIDESPDFALSADTDDSELDSDAELSDVASVSARGPPRGPCEAASSAVGELMTPDTLIELCEDRDVLQHHLKYNYAERGIMTRARYRALAAKNIAQTQHQELLALIVAQRKSQMEREERATLHDGYDDIDPRMACVICQTEPRTLITWPCKCLAICEGCRVSLVAKGMKGCVCCRQDVEGMSRIFLP
ncbi:hypothetical protein METBIDRAFT_145446 [Metschnikowia bicuspidata var. bicuspidata NRRL YB-4993]|uniref:RING-type domain-containing protein n=1 Tax=Metschnikowia bicuspidata var. bicuspidata NRRL YB-4993 TaxID=869754 RepID=A0A1A0HD92_9ASCO|nr:hypothetical protein METBIDRAFT_145446 [Metschnikowia bicuspidata var. bicuspidata NRRL YB-4993]OBA22049.1 hypothetical protein METBIDRAFT_145446 [Metschnikowia bicuspidata var. bicuspidata NRRL YB-4993]